ILSLGQSSERMVPGKVLLGVETSMFDPILEQVGLGPVERSNISHMIGEVRTTIDATTPRVRQIVGTIEETVAGLKETSESVRPVYNAKQIGDVGLTMLTRNKVDIERTVANVKDATDWGSKLVQKIYANPFVLSPLYKPTPEDVRVQNAYDSAQVFANGAMKLDDAVKTLEAMQARPSTPQQREEP